MNLRTRLLSATPSQSAEKTIVERELDEILTEIDSLEAQSREEYPARPEPRSLLEIQRLLDPDTVLLEYSLGDERSFLWTIGQDFIEAFELAPAHEIEPKVRRLHELWSRLSPGDGAEERRLAAELSRRLLTPAAARLKHHRLVIVADGALYYLPFSALPDPLATGAAPQPLLIEHEIVSLPSASVLAAQRRRETSRQPSHSRVAVLADPIFDSHDPRANPAQATPAGNIPARALPARALSPSLTTPATEGLELARLTGSQQEAEALTAILPAGEVLVALGAQANRSLLLGGSLADARILHLSTHGIFDDARPRLSGLILSRIDEKGEPIDGFVGLADVYDLDLLAELVVLSGCRTALGKEVRGEGLLGLTHGFFHAGAERVLASLWQVQDRATAELMGQFYRSYLADGLPPASALAVAQRSIARDPRWRDPYYWAVFVLQGDWR